MLEWHIGVEVDVLVLVCTFSEEIEGERAVGVALNVDVQLMNEAVNFLFLGPCDVWVKGVDVCE